MGKYLEAYVYLMELPPGKKMKIENEEQYEIIREVIDAEIMEKGYTTLSIHDNVLTKIKEQ